MQTVKVEVDQKLFKFIMAKMPWLAYENLEAFVGDAVRARFEALLALTAKPKN